ncbi:MAG: hypothetical protein Kow0010_03490 [Dehalococcoidia bacterium]
MPLGQHCHITAREREVLAALAQDLTVPEVAELLTVAVDTVRAHLRNLHQKTGTRTIHGLLAWTRNHDICCIEPGAA